MASPLDKNNSIITGIDGLPEGTEGGLIQAEEEGNSITYASNGAFEGPAGAPLAGQYLARRGAGGWATMNLMPPIYAESYEISGYGGPYKMFSPDLSKGLLFNGSEAPARNPPPSEKAGEEAPAGYRNYFLRDNHTNGLQAVVTKAQTPSEPASEFEIKFRGASSDLSHAVFATPAALTPHAVTGSIGNNNLYEWSSGGGLQLINLLPGEKGEKESTPGAFLGVNYLGNPSGINPVSNDGSKVFFTDEHEGKFNLYARINGLSTVELDASQEGLESGEGIFQAASNDGLKVFFEDKLRLTKDSTANALQGIVDLYEYNFENGRLSDLTTKDSRGANVQGVVGTSGDGSYVYFIANGVLAPGASRGYCSGSKKEGSRKCNL
jgi:hypothetical protein